MNKLIAAAVTGFAVGFSSCYLIFANTTVIDSTATDPALAPISANSPSPASTQNTAVQNATAAQQTMPALATVSSAPPSAAPTAVSSTSNDNADAVVSLPDNIAQAYEQQRELAQGANSDMRQLFARFEQQSRDMAWSDDLEQKIREFIYAHDFAYAVELHSIVCKTTVCEFSATIRDQQAWRTLYDDLFRQPWWKFTIAQKDTIDNPNTDESYLYLLLAVVYIN